MYLDPAESYPQAMAQWKIAGRQNACTVCGHEFADGERHHSMVRIIGDRIDRFDACQPLL